MCVHHNQLDMFDHLLEYCGASDSVKNVEGFTPLVLAASLGLSDMFQHICNKRRKVGWSYGPVSFWSSPVLSREEWLRRTRELIHF
jgi:ankyrin repeat protein